ncbi:hypothetical protein AB0H00_01600 [Nocardia sp. NPDC023852]
MSPRLAVSRDRRFTFEIAPAGDKVAKLTVVHDGFEPGSHL